MFTVRSARLTAAAVAALVSIASVPAFADPLISASEAKLPNDSSVLGATRGITRGPTIRPELPSGTIAAGKPFDFHILFQAHGGAKVDTASVRVTYLKSPHVDLTPRLKPYITAQGIDMSKAEIPAGVHELRVQVEDSDGHMGSTVVTLNAAR